MKKGPIVRLKTSALELESVNGQLTANMIPEGASIQIVDEFVSEDRMVYVEHRTNTERFRCRSGRARRGGRMGKHADLVVLPLPCETKVDLLALYWQATAAYNHAVSGLERAVEAPHEAACDDLVHLSRSARRFANEAREEFKKHVAAHGC